jgi:predicted MPP superfamily phosphohydrolase
MHVYAFFRLQQTYAPDRTTTALLSGWLVLMTITPLLVRLFERADQTRAALWFAWPGYIWMGCIFIFCTIMIVLDVSRITWQLINQNVGMANSDLLSAAVTCKVAIILSFLISGYAIYEAQKIRTDHLTIVTPKLSPSSTGIRVVQITDVHIGLLFRESRLKSVLQAIKDSQPDVLVSTGDLVDGRLSKEDAIANFSRLAVMLSEIPTKIGKFAAVGNHEYYAGLNQALAFTRKAGFTVLRNQSVSLPEGITITGLDDPAYLRMGLPESTPTESDLAQTISSKHFHLLLKHRPTVSESIDGKFDLQLSGHVHNGQIFPFNFLVRLQYPIPCGTSRTPKNSMIHVSRGSGTWGPPMRLLAAPEVTVIDIVPAQPDRKAE